MAISYSVSFTFSPSTTISSSQVNTNFSDNSNTWNGIEAKTKTFSNLGVDTELKSGGTIKSADGTVAAPGITFVSNTGVGLSLSGSSITLSGLNAWAYRRPVLKYSSGTVVNLETGNNGSSGIAAVLFPDGNLRTDSSSGRINCNLAQVASLTGTAQSGLQTGSVSTNEWYAVYAVKSQVNTTDFVTVADLANIPVQANFATLNSNFGTNSWVYLGLIRNGDNSTSSSGILTFVQSGNFTEFTNSSIDNTGSSDFLPGTTLANSASATSLTWTYSAGSGAAQVPANVGHILYTVGRSSPAADKYFYASSPSITHEVFRVNSSKDAIYRFPMAASEGLEVVTETTAVKLAIQCAGFWDTALGVGSNPLL